MYTKALMISSAVAMMALGLTATFVPDDLLRYCGSNPQPLSILIVQAAGALYLGFAIMNWMAKENLIGGIYSRPVALGNFLHFFVMAAALVKALNIGQRTAPVWIVAFFYAIFATWFGLVLFGNPLRNKVAEGIPRS